ncbi:MAG TPA: hypothetical protein VHM89_03830 [Acidimicrobiales bacterium]|nr:hypothetical protein [Acidimicrobiales bacterium]
MDLAYAVVHDEPPQVYAAENADVLQLVIAFEAVARTPAATLAPDTLQALRDALLEERWGDAVELWMRTSGTVVDVYPDGLKVWTAGLIQADIANVRLQFTPLFAD